MKIPIRNYLAAILPGLAELLPNRVAQLTPAWLAFSSFPSVNYALHRTDTSIPSFFPGATTYV
jgi:hypothetical protein